MVLRRPTFAVLIVLLALTSCRQVVVRPAEAQLAFESSRLDFHKVPLGSSSKLALRLRNRGLVSAEAALVADGAFSITPPRIRVPAATSVSLEVSFTPLEIGRVAGFVTSPEAGGVELSGEGIEACAASDSCHVSTFDSAAQLCVDTVLADGVPCESACLTNAHCESGVCAGNSERCDDGNACTVDVCDPSGKCATAPMECPVSDGENLGRA